jgi:hypothetical protein
MIRALGEFGSFTENDVDNESGTKDRPGLKQEGNVLKDVNLRFGIIIIRTRECLRHGDRVYLVVADAFGELEVVQERKGYQLVSRPTTERFEHK